MPGNNLILGSTGTEFLLILREVASGGWLWLASPGVSWLYLSQHNRHAYRRSATLAVFLCLFGVVNA